MNLQIKNFQMELDEYNKARSLKKDKEWSLKEEKYKKRKKDKGEKDKPPNKDKKDRERR